MTGEDIIIIIDEQSLDPVVIPGGEYYRGPAGADGAPLTYEDLTTEQILSLQAPALGAAEIAIEAAGQVSDVIVIAEQTIDDAEQATINANTAAVQLVDGAESGYNTLKKLQDKLKVVEGIIGDAAGDEDDFINTVREALEALHGLSEGVNIANLLSQKVSITDIYNGLDCIIEGKVADARTVTALKGLIDSLTTIVGNKLNKPANTQNTLSDNDAFVLRKVDGTVVEILKTDMYAILDNYFTKLSGGNTFIDTQNFLNLIQHISGQFFYEAASLAADTLNDRRFSSSAGVFKVERCTVASAAKGAGAWVVDIQINSDGKIGFGVAPSGSNNIKSIGNIEAASFVTSIAALGSTILYMPNNFIQKWSSTAAAFGAADLGISKNASGVGEVNSGTPGQYRDWKVRKCIQTETPQYADNAAAIAGGLTAGMDYMTGDIVKRVR